MSQHHFCQYAKETGQGFPVPPEIAAWTSGRVGVGASARKRRTFSTISSGTGPGTGSPVLEMTTRAKRYIVGDQPPGHPVDLTLVGVVFALGGFIRSPIAHQVGGQHPESCPGEKRNHVAVEIAPGGLTVHAQNHRCLGIALIHMMNSELPTVAVGHFGVDRREGVAGEIFETFVGRAQGFHDGFSFKAESGWDSEARGIMAG